MLSEKVSQSLAVSLTHFEIRDIENLELRAFLKELDKFRHSFIDAFIVLNIQVLKAVLTGD